MKVERYTVQSCCGKTAVIFKTDRPIKKECVAQLVALGWREQAHFTQAGILYVDNPDFILTGPIGQDRLTVKCKHADCTQKLNDLEVLLQQVG